MSADIFNHHKCGEGCCRHLVGRGRDITNHPTMPRTPLLQQRILWSKCEQCQAGETLDMISNHKVMLSFEVDSMLYSPNSGRLYQPPHLPTLRAKFRFHKNKLFQKLFLAPSKPSLLSSLVQVRGSFSWFPLLWMLTEGLQRPHKGCCKHRPAVCQNQRRDRKQKGAFWTERNLQSPQTEPKCNSHLPQL